MGLEADIEQFRDGDELKSAIQKPFVNMPRSWPKTFIYAGHGSQERETLGQVEDPRYKRGGLTFSTAKVADSIMHHRAYKSSAQIFLAVCSSGASGSSVAREMAVRTGKPVIAPDKMLWITKGGYYFSADPKPVGADGKLKADTTKMGTLRKFTPDGKSGVIQPFYSGPGVTVIPAQRLAPSAAEIDTAHQATGVPGLGAESVNRANGRL